MKIKYKLVLLLIILFLTGCTVKANVSINTDYTVDENINVLFNNSSSVNYETPTEYAKSYLNHYSSVINSKKYNYSIKDGLDTSTVSFNKTSNNICDIINTDAFSQYLYKYITCRESDDYYEIVSEGNQLVSVPLNEKKFNVEAVELNLTLPVSSEENNADEVNDKTYTWVYHSSSSTDKSIYVKISKEQLKQAKKAVDDQVKKGKQMKAITVVISIVVIIAILLFVTSIFYKKYKSNRLDY